MTRKLLIGIAALFVATCALLILVAPIAQAGVYQVLECDRNFEPLTAPDAVYFEEATGFEASNNNCQDGPEFSLRVDHDSADIPDGKRAYWYFLSPTGTAFVAAKLQADLRNGDDGLKAKLVMSNQTDDDDPARHIFAEGGGGFGSRTWFSNEYSGGDGGSPRRYFLAELKCQGSASQGSKCSNNSSGAHARVRDLNFHLSDMSAPQISQSGALLAGGWRRGTDTLSYAASDQGSGLRSIKLIVNGNVGTQTLACEVLTNPSTVAKRLQPCATSGSEELAADTTTPPFHEGANTVRYCAIDFPGDLNGNEACTAAQTVMIDNAPPQNPQGLTVEGGSGWRPANDFDVSWTNPAQPNGSGISGAVYRITEVGGGYDSGPQFVAGANRSSFESLQVPDVGEYRLKVWLRDEAGNESEAESETVTLRFDDTRPPEAAPKGASGWISRTELPYHQLIVKPTETLPPSGIVGYAVLVSGNDTDDPCAAEDRCTAAETDLNDGVDGNDFVIPELAEGTHYVHSVAVSGSGMKSTAVRSAQLKVDRTNPTADAVDLPDGWTNQSVAITIGAADSLSGMEPNPMDDGQPFTAVKVDDNAALKATGNSATTGISAEGVHAVLFWARDLAGNESDQRSAEVKIDKTAPAVAFTNAQSPNDPDQIRANISDGLSGPEGGVISYREVGASQWTDLETTLDSGQLVARINSDELEHAATYEFQATGRDAAGNLATTTQRENGGSMTLTMPIKVQTALSAQFTHPTRCDGQTECLKRTYGKSFAIAGRLRSGAVGVAARPVVVTEEMDPGSAPERHETTVLTDADGRFSLALSPGPSRVTRVTFPGTQDLGRSTAEPLRSTTRSHVSFNRAPSKVLNGSTVRMYGTVKHEGALIPAGGKLVSIQYLDTRGADAYRTIALVRTDPSGFYSYTYRFRSITRPTRIRFRSLAEPESTWPFARRRSVTSRTVTVYP